MWLYYLLLRWCDVLLWFVWIIELQYQIEDIIARINFGWIKYSVADDLSTKWITAGVYVFASSFSRRGKINSETTEHVHFLKWLFTILKHHMERKREGHGKKKYPKK